jgi:hypothetical protein
MGECIEMSSERLNWLVNEMLPLTAPTSRERRSCLGNMSSLKPEGSARKRGVLNRSVNAHSQEPVSDGCDTSDEIVGFQSMHPGNVGP